MSRLLFKMLIGCVAAVVAWALIEPTNPGLKDANAWSAFELRLICLEGVLLGLALGGVDGYLQGSRLHILRGAVMGAVLGIIGMLLGYQIGGSLATSLFGGVVSSATPVGILSRTVALAPAGLFLGLGIGASTLNSKRLWQSGLGGLLGGAAGGALFNIVGGVIGSFGATVQGVSNGNVAEVGQMPRAITLTLIGGCIGLFIGLVELITRSAWVRLKLGRNEGKEWPIDAAQTFIGRSEKAGIPIFGDPNVAPMHACIMKNGNDYSISDGGSPAGTLVNGQRIGQATLFHGAIIQIAGYTLEFLMKKGAAPVRGPEHFNQAYAIHDPVPGPPMGQPGYPPQPHGYGTAAGAPAPGSLYGAPPGQMAPTQMMPAGSPFQSQQPTVAFPSAGSQPTMAYGAVPGGFSLVAMDGPIAGQRFPVMGPMELGRESASIPMSYDTGASRRHASISPGPMGLMVTDLNSTNGTFVNGQRVQSASAGPGALIKVGATTFRVEPG